jgi:hypothetical protein
VRLNEQAAIDQRRTISAFGVGLAPEQKSRPRNHPSPRHFESEPGSIPVGTLWRPERHGAWPAAGGLLFYFCQLIRHVRLLVFLLVSATIDDKTVREFRELCIRRLSARGTRRAFAIIRQRSLSSITTGTSRIFGFAAVRPNLMVSGEFHGIFHGRSLGSWYRDFWVESNRCRSRTTPIFGT